MPKKVIHDRAKFLMPKSRELQFPAMAVLQAYVNDFEKKAYFTAMVDVGYRMEFEYCVDMPSHDWQLFQDAGIELRMPPVDAFDGEDLLADFTEERLSGYQWRRDQHVAQLYGSMIGVESRVFPVVRQVLPGGTQWYQVDAGCLPYPQITGEDIACAKDEQIRGVIGRAGWETYLACAMGMPVIEIKPTNSPVNWLSKWINKNYRLIDENGTIARQLDRAIDDIERSLCTLARVETTTDLTTMGR